jgi:hypothetical protein
MWLHVRFHLGEMSAIAKKSKLVPMGTRFENTKGIEEMALVFYETQVRLMFCL